MRNNSLIFIKFLILLFPLGLLLSEIFILSIVGPSAGSIIMLIILTIIILAILLSILKDILELNRRALIKHKKELEAAAEKK